jgi:hypothetical protein
MLFGRFVVWIEYNTYPHSGFDVALFKLGLSLASPWNGLHTRKAELHPTSHNKHYYTTINTNFPLVQSKSPKCLDSRFSISIVTFSIKYGRGESNCGD